MVRKMAAASGLANRVRKVCSRASPVMPTGMVAMTSSQASRSSASVVTMRRAAMAGPKGAPEPADDPHPVGSEEDDQSQCGGHVQGDDDGQVGA